MKQFDQFDIYFLELDLKETNGQELAIQIRNNNPTAEIIILNSDDFYRSFSYKINSCYYLMKPITKSLLDTALAIAFSRIKQKKCIIKTKEGYQKIILDDLLYINIEQRSSCFHLKNNITFFSTCLHESFCKENNYLLNHPELLLIEPSLIVNLDNIEILNREKITFTNKDILYLPRKAYNKIYSVWSYYHLPKEREEIF